MSHKGGSGFGNGLIVGMIFGAILVLLFTTKKGRKILRLLSEEGFEKVKDWEHILDELELDDNEEMDSDYISQERTTDSRKVILTNGSNGYSHHAIHRVKPTSRRFFRGIPKR